MNLANDSTTTLNTMNALGWSRPERETMDNPPQTISPMCMDIYVMLLAFRNVWSRINYDNFMEYFFSDIPTDDLRYEDDYHLNKWSQFSDTPLKFFCEIDTEKRQILCGLIEKNVIVIA